MKVRFLEPVIFRDEAGVIREYRAGDEADLPDADVRQLSMRVEVLDGRQDKMIHSSKHKD